MYNPNGLGIYICDTCRRAIAYGAANKKLKYSRYPHFHFCAVQCLKARTDRKLREQRRIFSARRYLLNA